MPNRLAAAASPYLQQHADNPVDWMEWGEEAFARAGDEGKPIFLSIGYSTCHWCHVMAHESFENEAIAAQLNRDFVAIKVDREERPDVDRVYMAYVQAVSGHGGWPLSAWLTPALKPFFGGTYFPPEDQHGRAGFPTVLEQIADGWRRDRARIEAESDRVVEALAGHFQDVPVGEAAPDLVEAGGDAFERAYAYLFENYDAAEGGFGGAPKFPRPANLEFLLRCVALQGVDSETGRDAVGMVTRTLERMAMGGIHDQVGGGFHRYAVDAAWFVPHFEKMLYDQAQIALNLIDAHAVTGDERFAWVAGGILDYVRRDLTHPEGGFFAAEDADSPGPDGGKAEGAFYTWTPAELQAVLGEDAAWVGSHFGVTAAGNVPEQLDPHGEMRGRSVLKQQRPLSLTATMFDRDPTDLVGPLGEALARLREARAQRPRPHRDEKVIAAWNGLMIAALARAAGCPAEPLAAQAAANRDAAVAAARFAREHLWDEATGTLRRSWRDGRVVEVGFAEDYAAMIFGLLELYEATFDVAWLEWAAALQAQMDARFWDESGGGYFQAPAGDPSIVLRLKDDQDGAEPSANSLGAANLLRLGALFHDEERRHRGALVLQALRDRWTKMPWALPAMLTAVEWALETPRQVVLAGPATAANWAELAAVARRRDGRRRVVLALRDETERKWWSQRVPALGAFAIDTGTAQAQVCEGFACQLPVTTAADLLLNVHG